MGGNLEHEKSSLADSLEGILICLCVLPASLLAVIHTVDVFWGKFM
jgi:hypothetical protein